MPLFHLPTTTYPYPASQLRQDYPATCWPTSPTVADLAQGTGGEVVLVTPTAPPPFNAATHRLVEDPPTLAGGGWTQTWRLIDLTPAEQAEWAAQHRPPPDWSGFLEAFFTVPAFAQALQGGQQALETLAASASPADQPAIALAGLSLSELGSLLATQATPGTDPAALMQAWSNLYAVGLVTPEVQAGILALATAHNLPPDLIAALEPPG